MADIANIEYL